MKHQILSKLALAALAVTVCSYSANAQLGNLKNKVKNATNNATGGNNNSSSSSTSNTNTSNSSSNPVSSATSATESNPGWYKVSVPTCVFSNDYGFSSTKTSFEPGENIFMRFAFPKSVGETFAELMGLSNIPSTGKMSLAIAKNVDDENPIIMYSRDIFTSRYTKDNVIDFTLQSDEKTIESIANGAGDVPQKVCFNSQGTMGNNGLNDEWLRQAGLFANGSKDWEVFLVFSPWNGTDPNSVKMAAQGKFKYTVTSENKAKLASGMNFYDKQNYEKTPDDGVVTGVHKANQEKIVFAKNKMKKDFDDASALKTSFENLAGGLYARLYLKESARNILANSGKAKDISSFGYRIEFYVDGKAEYSCYADDKLSQDDAINRTSWAIALAPNAAEDNDMNSEITHRFAYVISELGPGKHKIKMRATYSTDITAPENTLAEGEFEITIVAADRDAYVKKHGLQLPAKGLLESDAKLAAEVKKVSGTNVIDVRCPNSWEYRKDMFGQITHRTTIVVFSFKDKDNRCKMGTYMIKQMKTGSGYGVTEETVEEKTWYGVDNYLPFQNSK